MRRIERMLVALLAAGLVGGCCSDSPDSCPEYDNERVQGIVDLQVINARTTPLYYDTCGTLFEFVVNGVAHQPFPNALLDTCAYNFAVAPTFCFEVGLSSNWFELGPGLTEYDVWDARFYEKTQMPGRCVESGLPKDCVRGVAAPGGPIQVVATLYATKTCSSSGCIYTDPVTGTADVMYTPGETKDISIDIVP